jgi:hypothetical protein
MWFPEKMPRSWHWLLTIIIPVHAATALITIGAFIIHIYVLMVPGGLKGIAYRRVSEE